MSINRQTVTVHRRLRPVRLAFLVRPDDGKTLRKVIETSTCLWGGRFNGIIPVFRRTPRWWSDRPIKSWSASEIVRGYLSAFEPDYVVTTGAHLANGLDLEDGRLITLAEVLSSTREEHIGCGLGVMEVYRDLYQREFQFVRRHPAKVVRPKVADRHLSLFAAACFGAFPRDKALSYISRGFDEAFDPQDATIDGANLFEVLTAGVGTTLIMGSAGLDVRRRGWSSGPVLFFMDGTKARDLIDYWNLRALGWRVLPVPKQWADTLVDPCSRFVRESNVPYRHNPEMKQWTTLLRSRSTTRSEVEAFARRIHVPGEHALSLQDWYPRMWDDWARDKDHVQRCDVTAKEGDTECTVENGRIAFRSLTPAFADRFGWGDKARWVNVVRVRDYWPGSELALVLPPGLRDLDRVLQTFDRGATSVSTEGIVLRCRHHDWTHRWTLPDGLAVFRHWLGAQNLTVGLSGAGRIAQQVIRSLGGPWGAQLIADGEIVKLLHKMAHGMIESPAEQKSTGSRKPPVRGRVVIRGRWLELLKKANEGNIDRAAGHLATLVERGVLRVGLKVQCPVCGQANWFSPGAILDVLRCERCLRDFPFPAADPPSGDWWYRTQGPFSVENYAQGGYAVALALRFLTSQMHAETTWVAGLEISEASGVLGEIDFGVWWRRESAFDADEPVLLLGECKSFDQFATKEVERAKRFAERFPGATLVFATLREELEASERKRLAALARAGRKYLKADKWRAPVLVLTSLELMSDMGPPYCWRDAGGRFAQFAQNFRGFGGLTELCDATQQLHLGLEPYGQWQHEEFERRRQRWLRFQAKRSKREAKREGTDPRAQVDAPKEGMAP